MLINVFYTLWMEHLVVSSKSVECCFDCLYFPSKACTGVNVSIKHFISMKMHFPAANSSTGKLSATLPYHLVTLTHYKRLRNWLLKRKQWEKEWCPWWYDSAPAARPVL